MKRPRCLLIRLCCLGALLPLAAQAANNPPAMKEQRLAFSLQERTEIERVAGKIVAQAGPEFSGYIQLAWFDEVGSPDVRRLRQQLMRSGISAQQIMLIQESGAVPQPDTGLQVRIKQPAHQPDTGPQVDRQSSASGSSPCRYATQNYRFNLYDEQGCALYSMLNSSLIHFHRNSD